MHVRQDSSERKLLGDRVAGKFVATSGPRRHTERCDAAHRFLAALTDDQIDQMSHADLVDTLRQAETLGSQCAEIRSRLEFYDNETLRRLAYLARRSLNLVE